MEGLRNPMEAFGIESNKISYRSVPQCYDHGVWGDVDVGCQ